MKSLVIITALSTKLIESGMVDLCQKALLDSGYKGQTYVITSNDNIRLSHVLANLKDYAPLEGVDSVLVINADVLAISDPSKALANVVNSGLVGLAQGTDTVGSLHGRLRNATASMGVFLFQTDCIAFKVGQESQTLFDGWVREIDKYAGEDDCYAFNASVLESGRSLAYFPADIFSGYKEYKAPLVRFCGQWYQAKEWTAGRNAVHDKVETPKKEKKSVEKAVESPTVAETK
jgi:hypothetical protein